MARLARIVIPNVPHHVTQCGNRGERVFFGDDDSALYRDLLSQRCRKAGVACWAYCLTPNHVHLILVPAHSDGLARALGERHRRYTGFVNARARQTARFGSVAMDEDHLLAAVRTVSLNPVRARLVARARDWRWSSVRAHLAGTDDALVAVRPLLDRVRPFADLAATASGKVAAAKSAAETLGRSWASLGNDALPGCIEAALGRTVRPSACLLPTIFTPSHSFQDAGHGDALGGRDNPPFRGVISEVEVADRNMRTLLGMRRVGRRPRCWLRPIAALPIQQPCDAMRQVARVEAQSGKLPTVTDFKTRHILLQTFWFDVERKR